MESKAEIDSRIEDMFGQKSAAKTYGILEFVRDKSRVRWADLEKQFHSYFYSGIHEMKLSDLTSIKQKHDEPVHEYIQRFREMRNKYDSLSLIAAQLADLAFQGMIAPIREKFSSEDFESLSHLTQKVALHEQSGYDFDITKADKIFDLLLREKQIATVPASAIQLPSRWKNWGKKMVSANGIMSGSHTTNDCKGFRQQIQAAIEGGKIKFDDSKRPMKVDGNPFPVNMVHTAGRTADGGRARGSMTSSRRSIMKKMTMALILIGVVSSLDSVGMAAKRLAKGKGVVTALVNMVFTLPTEFGMKQADADEVEEESAKLILSPEQAVFEKPEGTENRHLKPLYINGYVNGKPMSKMMVDGGAVVNLMPYATFRKLGRNAEDLIKTNMVLKDFGGNPSETKGGLNVELTVGNKTIPTTFFVIDGKGSYSLLLGRDWIHANCCIPSAMHQCLIKWQGDKIEIVPTDSYYFEGVVEGSDVYNKDTVDDFDDKQGQGFMSADDLEEIDIGPGDRPRPTFISKNLSAEFRTKLIEQLKEFRDCFAWEYYEMPGLSRSIVEHRLPIKPGVRPHQQPPRRCKADMLEPVKAEIKRLYDAGFIRPCRYAEWVSSIVPIIKKNGKFLGFLVHERGIEVTQRSVNAIKKIQPPENKTELQEMIGKINFVRRFISNLSGRLRHYLLSNECTIICKADVVKYMLSAPILKGRVGKWIFSLTEFDLLYESPKAIKGQAIADFIVGHRDDSFGSVEIVPWTLFFDGSVCTHGCGIGLVIISPRGVCFEFAYTIKPYATNNQAEYEAVLKGLQLLKEVEADAIEILVDSLLVISQLSGEYECKNDTLMVYNEKCQELMKEFRLVTLKHAKVAIGKVHEGICGTHQSAHKMKWLLQRAGYFWPTMLEDCFRYYKGCQDCQKFGAIQRAPASAMNPIIKPWPFRGWGIDMIGMINPPSSKGHEFILVATDYFTKWVEAIPLKKVDSGDAIQFVQEHIIYRFGILQTITTDQGSIFVSDEFVQFADSTGIKLLNSSPYYIQANGQAGASNKSLIKLIKRKISDYPRQWHIRLAEALWSYRMACHGSIQVPPYKLVYGHEVVLPWEVRIVSRRMELQNDLTADEYYNLMADEREDLVQSRLRALAKLTKDKERVARHYNKKVVPNDFSEGELVWKLILPIGTQDSKFGKWSPNWEGPFQIYKVVSKGAYMLQGLDRQVYGRALNGKYLKKYYPSVWVNA
uniref:OSJNBa0028M15.17 protein n=1 Tax=Oryza sativa subsp. japonica TaxID=39947 RepID=Q7XK70_ORYSJ|nr:OSJNBa0028M15.17 [Oryza sativa Japonica Group]